MDLQMDKFIWKQNITVGLSFTFESRESFYYWVRQVLDFELYMKLEV